MAPHRLLAFLVSLAWLSNAHGQRLEQLDQSRYYRKGAAIYYGKDTKTPLTGADAKSFVAHIPCPHPYRYGVALAADKNAFYLDGERIRFSGASKAKLVACFSNGTCTHLVQSGNTLYRINQNAKSVQRVATTAKGFSPIATEDDAISPGYFRDSKHVYFYDLDNHQLRALPKVSPAHFKAHAAQYSFALYWGQDGRRVYVGHQQIHGADAKTFQYVGWVYAKDKSRVYRLSSRAIPAWFAIPGADPKSFRHLKGRGIDACDRKRCYSRGKPARGR